MKLEKMILNLVKVFRYRGLSVYRLKGSWLCDGSIYKEKWEIEEEEGCKSYCLIGKKKSGRWVIELWERKF